MSGNDHTVERASSSEADDAARLKVLLGLLADADCERRGLISTMEETEETARWYRARFNLLRRSDLERFLSSARLCEADFVAHMRTFSNIALAQRAHQEELERRMPRYQGVFSVRDWVLRREYRGDGRGHTGDVDP